MDTWVGVELSAFVLGYKEQHLYCKHKSNTPFHNKLLVQMLHKGYSVTLWKNV